MNANANHSQLRTTMPHAGWPRWASARGWRTARLTCDGDALQLRGDRGSHGTRRGGLHARRQKSIKQPCQARHQSWPQQPRIVGRHAPVIFSETPAEQAVQCEVGPEVLV